MKNGSNWRARFVRRRKQRPKSNNPDEAGHSIAESDQDFPWGDLGRCRFESGGLPGNGLWADGPEWSRKNNDHSAVDGVAASGPGGSADFGADHVGSAAFFAGADFVRVAI